MRDREKAKAIITTILNLSDGGKVKGVARLNNIFYVAHLFHWKDEVGVLSDYPIISTHNGPGIYELHKLADELYHEKIIYLGSDESNGLFKDHVYAASDYQPYTLLTKDELRSIRKAVEWTEKRSDIELSYEVRRRSWYHAAVGEEMGIYIDLIRDKEYQEMKERQARIKKMLEDTC